MPRLGEGVTVTVLDGVIEWLNQELKTPLGQIVLLVLVAGVKWYTSRPKPKPHHGHPKANAR